MSTINARVLTPHIGAKLERYKGYLREFLPEITALWVGGVPYTEIGCCLVDRVYSAVIDDHWWWAEMKREDRVRAISGIVQYIFKDRVNRRWRPRRVDRGRVIDMGGPRDVWVEWTPERNYRELCCESI